ncbi:MAG: MaoC family dehydratase [bacterium]
MTQTLPPGLYQYDQLQIGDQIDTGTAQITSAAILAFAQLSGDQFEIHLSGAGAIKHGFPAQVAHGLLVLSLVEGLKSSAPARIAAYASLGWDLRFRKPVLAGDQIHCTLTVAAKRPRATQGIITLDVQVFNQLHQLVQSGQTRMMAYR